LCQHTNDHGPAFALLGNGAASGLLGNLRRASNPERSTDIADAGGRAGMSRSAIPRLPTAFWTGWSPKLIAIGSVGMHLRHTESDENGCSDAGGQRPVQQWSPFRGSVWPQDARRTDNWARRSAGSRGT